jgi:hypothetical protein
MINEINDKISAFTKVLDTLEFIENYNLYMEKVKKDITICSSLENMIINKQSWMGISLSIITHNKDLLNYKYSFLNVKQLEDIFIQIHSLIKKRVSFSEFEIRNLDTSSLYCNCDYSSKISNMFKFYLKCIFNEIIFISKVKPEVKMEIETIEKEYVNVKKFEKINVIFENIIALSGQVIVKVDKRQYHGAKRHKLVKNIDQIKKNDIFVLAKKTIKQLNTNLKSIEVEPGIYPIVFGSGEGSFFIHEIIGHLLETDYVTKKNNINIGAKLTDVELTIYDQKEILASDKSQVLKKKSGLNFIRKLLVDRGTLKNFINSEGDYNSNVRSSYIYDEIPRMSCIYIKNGNIKPNKIIESIDNGYYVVDFIYGNLNPKTLNFRLKASEAYKIINGEIVNPVNDLILESNALKALTNLALIGDNLSFYPIKCFKNGQIIWTEAGQPTLRVNKIKVY